MPHLVLAFGFESCLTTASPGTIAPITRSAYEGTLVVDVRSNTSFRTWRISTPCTDSNFVLQLCGQMFYKAGMTARNVARATKALILIHEPLPQPPLCCNVSTSRRLDASNATNEMRRNSRQVHSTYVFVRDTKEMNQGSVFECSSLPASLPCFSQVCMIHMRAAGRESAREKFDLMHCTDSQSNSE